MKVRKQKIPPEIRYELNRLINGAEMANDMTARDNYPKGSYFIMHDVLYLAIQAIPKGTEVKPGKNCVIKSLNELNGGN